MKHLEPKAAYEFLKKNPNSVFIDCRSEMEYLFVGHPVGAILVPWNDGPNWEVNPYFVAHVKKAAQASSSLKVESARATALQSSPPLAPLRSCLQVSTKVFRQHMFCQLTKTRTIGLYFGTVRSSLLQLLPSFR